MRVTIESSDHNLVAEIIRNVSNAGEGKGAWILVEPTQTATETEVAGAASYVSNKRWGKSRPGNRRRFLSKGHKRPCNECGRVYIAHRKDSRFCGKRCGDRAWKKAKANRA